MKKHIQSFNKLSKVFCAISLLHAGTALAQDSVIEALKYQKGSYKENDFRALRTELLVSKNEKRALAQINKLLRKYKNTPIEADLLFRKAELHVRQAKTERYLELNRDAQHIVRWVPKRVKSASSKNYINKAIHIYDRIISRHKYFEKIDIVIFNNAYSNQQIDNTQKAEKLYWKLISEYGGSPLTPDAHLAIGEMAFKQQRFKHALSHFNAIKKYPQSRVYPYGIYKAAWTKYNLQDATSALKELEKVVVYGRYVEEQNIDARLDLRKEALADMTLFFSEVFPASKAYDYFKTQAGALDAAPYILKLSHLYQRHSRYKDRAIVLADFIKNERKSAYLPKAYADMAENYETLKDRPKVVAILNDFYQLCLAKSDWAKHYDQVYKAEVAKAKEKEKAAVENHLAKCSESSQKITLNYASKWLKYWKKSKQVLFADSSESAFEIYLKYDLKTKKYYDAQFVFAELLFQRNKFRRASEQYYSVALNTKIKKQAHDASYAAIISLEKDVKDKWNDKDEESFKKLAEVYFKDHPNAKFTLDLKFKIALIAYQKERYDEAAPQFLEIGSKYGKTEKGQKAQDIYLDILNLKKDYEGLKKYTKTLMAGSKDKKRNQKLKKIYEESYFVQVQKQEEEKKYEKAIEGYLSFYRENPTSKLSSGALWNAIHLSHETGKALAAAKWSIEFQKKYPKHKNALAGLSRAAEIYEDMGQLDEAAAVLLKLSIADSKDSKKWKYLAANFYKIDQNYRKAKPIYNELWRSNDPQYSFNSLIHLRDIAKKSKSKGEYERLLKEVAQSQKEPFASEANLYFLENIFEQKKYAEAFQQAKSIIAARNKGADKSTLAKARFIQAQILEDEFQKQSLKTSVSRLALVLELKTSKLSKAQEAYQSTIKYGDPVVTVHALRQLAKVYKGYSDSLNQMPTPRGLPQEEVEAFRTEINRIAIPMEEKSVETLQQALQQAIQLGLQDGSVYAIQKELDGMSQQKSQQSIHKFEESNIVLPVFKGVGS